MTVRLANFMRYDASRYKVTPKFTRGVSEQTIVRAPVDIEELEHVLGRRIERIFIPRDERVVIIPAPPEIIPVPVPAPPPWDPSPPAPRPPYPDPPPLPPPGYDPPRSDPGRMKEARRILSSRNRRSHAISKRRPKIRRRAKE